MATGQARTPLPSPLPSAPPLPQQAKLCQHPVLSTARRGHIPAHRRHINRDSRRRCRSSSRRPSTMGNSVVGVGPRDSTVQPIRGRLVAPVRGSYLVELWKRRERELPIRRPAPRRAVWSAAELDRLAAMLSDAYDEHGMPAWGLLAISPRTAGEATAEVSTPAPRVIFTAEPLQHQRLACAHNAS